jgi:hypothetical protein
MALLTLTEKGSVSRCMGSGFVTPPGLTAGAGLGGYARQQARPNTRLISFITKDWTVWTATSHR